MHSHRVNSRSKERSNQRNLDTIVEGIQEQSPDLRQRKQNKFNHPSEPHVIGRGKEVISMPSGNPSERQYSEQIDEIYSPSAPFTGKNLE